MLNSRLYKLASPVAVAAHDAGAANLIIGWLRGQPNLEVRVCLGGPALKLWTAAFGKPQSLSPTEALRGAAVLLSGTSYPSDLEHQVRILAKASGIHSIGVIDHWVNYIDRFQRKGRSVLPDEIWVADEDALNLATACFPQIDIRQQPNLYLFDLVREVKTASSEAESSKPTRILYTLEPIRDVWVEGGAPGEFEALDYFIRSSRWLGFDRTTEIRLRPHPSDHPGKYSAWLARYADWNLRIDPSICLAESISWADMVVGCETYALVVALASGRRAVSSLPPHAPRCRLPMKGIIHLRDLVDSHFPG